MQISRKISGFLSSSASQSRNWENLWRAPVLQSPLSTVSARKASPKKNAKASSAHLRSTESAAEEISLAHVEDDPVKSVSSAQDVPKPGQIPWQPMVANSVNLVGYLGAPVRLGISSKDMDTAVSVLVDKKNLDLPHLRIPIIFRGDLAQIAACNLRENDRVYVTGELTGQAGSVDHDNQSKIQILVSDISYVLELSAEKEYEKSSAVESKKISVAECDKSREVKYEKNTEEEFKKSSAVEHGKSSPVPDVSSVSEKNFDKLSKRGAFWADLLENPNQWKDNREGKHTGKLNSKFPDFVHKSTEQALWLDSAPGWVVSKLETPKASPVKAPIQNENRNTRKAHVEEMWNDLVNNPNKWVDNRLHKIKPMYPDFKHKDSGEALWIDSSLTPSWVHDKLPAL